MHDVAPALCLGHVGKVKHQAGFDQLLRLPAMVELGGAHRVAPGDSADHDRTRHATGAGDRAVNPGVLGHFVERLGKLGNSRRLRLRWSTNA